MPGTIRVLLASLVVLVWWIGNVGAARATDPNWPHEPANATVLLDWPFDQVAGSGLYDPYNAGQLISDSTARRSPANVLSQVRTPGTSGGGTQLDLTINNYRDVFVGFWWKPNLDFEGNYNSSNKLLLLITNESPSVLTWYGPQNGTKVLAYNLQNSGILNNCHLATAVGDCPGGVNVFGNVSNGAVSLGAWHQVELRLRASTTSSSKDGILQWWLDGQLVGDFQNINLGPSPFNRFSLNHTWDSVNPTQTKIWEHRFDHLRISAINTGIADLPPGPPNAPAIRNVTVP